MQARLGRGVHDANPLLSRVHAKGVVLCEEPAKTMEKTRENAQLTKEIPCLKLTKELRKKNKERKARVLLGNTASPRANAGN